MRMRRAARQPDERMLCMVAALVGREETASELSVEEQQRRASCTASITAKPLSTALTSW